MGDKQVAGSKKQGKQILFCSLSVSASVRIINVEQKK